MSKNDKIIIKPILSEKSNLLSEQFGKYSFIINKDVNKIQLKSVIEEKFKVLVDKIAIINCKGKKKNMSIKSGGNLIRTSGFRADRKKAIVTLKKGEKIDLLSWEAK